MAATLKDWQNQTILALCALLRGRKSSSPSSKTSVDVTLATLLEDVWQHEERRPGDVAGRLFPDQPGVESRVRAYATWLREALELLADTPSGKRLPFDVRLEHGTWQLEFKPRDLDLKRFWAPHVSDRPTVVVCTAPLFIRNLRLRVLVRQLDLNREANWREHAQRWLHEQVRRFNPRGGTSLERGLSQLFTADFEAKRPYSTVGELKCTLRLAACMNRIGVPFEHALAHEPYPHSHLVMLGNARTNYTLNRFQKKHHLKFQLREASVRVGSGAGAVEYRDDLRPDGHVYGTIARFVDDGRAVTTIASNHSWAFEELGRILTDETALHDFLRQEKVQAGDYKDLPKQFEVLTKLILSAETERVEHVVVVATDGFARPAPLRQRSSRKKPRGSLRSPRRRRR